MTSGQWQSVGKAVLAFGASLFMLFVVLPAAAERREKRSAAYEAHQAEIDSAHETLRRATFGPVTDWRRVDSAVQVIESDSQATLGSLDMQGYIRTHVVGYVASRQLLERMASGETFPTVKLIDDVPEELKVHARVLGERVYNPESLFGLLDIDSLVAEAEIHLGRALVEHFRNKVRCDRAMETYAATPPDNWWDNYADDFESHQDARRRWYQVIGSNLSEMRQVHRDCNWTWDPAWEL